MTTANYFLRSRRLGFRLWSEDDLPLALALWGDENVTRLIDARGTLSGEDVKERLAGERRCLLQYGVQYWPIFLLANGEHVGCCGLRPHDLPRRCYELGFHIRSSHWRQGYAEEAARTVIDHAFTTLDIASLFAGHHPANEASRRLLLKLGFRYTGDQFYPPTGLEHPSYVLGREEYVQL